MEEVTTSPDPSIVGTDKPLQSCASGAVCSDTTGNAQSSTTNNDVAQSENADDNSTKCSRKSRLAGAEAKAAAEKAGVTSRDTSNVISGRSYRHIIVEFYFD